MLTQLAARRPFYRVDKTLGPVGPGGRAPHSCGCTGRGDGTGETTQASMLSAASKTVRMPL
jgi:hypothetical protein